MYTICLLQVDSQIEEQLFQLFHNERQIEDLANILKTEQKAFEKQVITEYMYMYIQVWALLHAQSIDM